MINKISTKEKSQLWIKFLLLAEHNTMLTKKLMKIKSDMENLFLNMFSDDIKPEEYINKVNSFNIENAQNLLSSLINANKQLEEVSNQLGFNEINPTLN